MNLRITTYLSYEGDGKVIEDLVARISELVSDAGFANDLSGDLNNTNLKSLIVVKENLETLVVDPNEFFAAELENSLLRVLPAKEIENGGAGTENSED